MEIEYKSFLSSTGISESDPPGTVSAAVSVFNSEDSGAIPDVVERGFFSDIQTRRTPDGLPAMKLVLGHDWLLPIGKVLHGEELAPGDHRLPLNIKQDGGLLLKGQLNLDTQRGREAYSDLKFGALTEWSFGYIVLQSKMDSAGRRHLIKGITYEASPVIAGLHPKTSTLGIKTAGAAGALSEDEALWWKGMCLLWDSLGVPGFKEGRVLSGANRDRLQSVQEHLSAASDHLQAVMDAAEPDEPQSSTPHGLGTMSAKALADMDDQQFWGWWMTQRARSLGVLV